MQRKCLLQLLLVQRRPLWGRWLLLLLLLARWRPLLGQVAPSITFACAAATAPGAGGSFYYFCLCGGDRSLGQVAPSITFACAGGDRSWGRWLLLLLLLAQRRPVRGTCLLLVLLLVRRPVSGAGGSFYSTFACAAATGPGAGGSF